MWLTHKTSGTHRGYYSISDSLLGLHNVYIEATWWRLRSTLVRGNAICITAMQSCSGTGRPCLELYCAVGDQVVRKSGYRVRELGVVALSFLVGHAFAVQLTWRS